MIEPIDRLTLRQKDCLRLVGRGYTSKEIGRLLAISPATVDNHIRMALDVLQVQGRAEAARLLFEREHDQPLTSQPQRLAEPTRSTPVTGREPTRANTWRTLVPPLGGVRNDLGWEGKTFAIFRVALAGLSVLALLTLGLAILLWALR